MQGSRNRGSWCGKMLRKAVPVRAERRRGLNRESDRVENGWRDVKRRTRAGPRSCGRLMRKCW